MGVPTLAPKQADRIPGPPAAAPTHITQLEERGARTLTTARGGSVAGRKKSGTADTSCETGHVKNRDTAVAMGHGLPARRARSWWETKQRGTLG
jgi:hypothetical protein